MRLLRARITNYRSVEDSGWVEFDDVTCLVGKNESGKTAFLQALNHLNPIKGSGAFDETMDFPSRRHAEYRRRADKTPANVIEAVFALTDAEMSAIASEFGRGFMRSNEVTVSKGYSSTTSYRGDWDLGVALKHMTGDLEVTAAVRTKLDKVTTFKDAKAILSEVSPSETVTAFLTRMLTWRDERPELHLVDSFVAPQLPHFFYFDDYSIMRGRVSIPLLRQRNEQDQLDDADETFLSLLSMVAADPADLENAENFERLTRELEAAANAVSDQVFNYWTQNTELQVQFAMSSPDANAQPPLDQGPILNVRVRNNKHRVTVPFDERSRGFVWFFSFFAYFSELERGDRDLILLLDEPGLNLHATAQRDFLKLIDERLAERYQVIYSTHSPFLVEAGRLDRVRTVQDVGDEGTKVSGDVFHTDADTLFPLQAALGYELAQTLFVGPNCLLVEGPSDMLYLQVLSEALRGAGRESLDAGWVVVPVGGADKLATFVSLLGANQLNTAVLMDVSNREQQRIANLQTNGHLKSNALVQISEVTGTKDADIEDLFAPAFYVELVNGAYKGELSKKLTITALPQGNPRIAIRVADYFKTDGANGAAFSHFPPAAYLLREQVRLIPKLDAPTLERAEQLFVRINSLLQPR